MDETAPPVRYLLDLAGRAVEAEYRDLEAPLSFERMQVLIRVAALLGDFRYLRFMSPSSLSLRDEVAASWRRAEEGSRLLLLKYLTASGAGDYQHQAVGPKHRWTGVFSPEHVSFERTEAALWKATDSAMWLYTEMTGERPHGKVPAKPGGCLVLVAVIAAGAAALLA